MIHQKTSLLPWVRLMSSPDVAHLDPIRSTRPLKPAVTSRLGGAKLAKALLAIGEEEKLEGTADKEVSLDSFPTDETWLAAFEAYVENNLKDVSLSVPQLADEFAMSESTLLRQVKRLTGLSPAKYLQEMRLNQAHHLLGSHSYLSVGEVAAEVGYAHPGSFARRFKDHFGKPPSDFQQA